ncbi:MAG: DNA gyrase subunit A, partial [Clostridia bacterium]|nr:DNA gyrase subunit A [Clostridia bacterium]
SEETDRHGMRIVVETKKDANAQVVLNTLFKQTQLQVNISMIMLALIDGVPRILNLKEILEAYIKHQIDVITRRTQFDLEKAQERAHILEGLAVALANIDEIVELLKKSSDRQNATENLMNRFNLSEAQSGAILDMRLQRLTGLEVEKITTELEQKHAEIAEYKRILADDNAIKQIIIDEMTDIKNRFATPRLSELSYDYSDLDIEDLIEREDIVISMTHGGYIKRQAVKEYHSQHRGGVGITGHKAKDDDFIERLFISNTHREHLFFTTFGKAFRLKGYEIPEASKNARGRAMVNLLQLEPGEQVKVVLCLPEEKEGLNLVLATRQGLIKRTPLTEFESVKRNGKIAIKFNEDDELIEAVLTSGNDELIMASSEGLCIRFNENTVRLVGRTAMGVKSMKLAEGAYIEDLAVVHEDSEILTITSNGFGKRSPVSDYPLQGRAGKGVKAGNFNEQTGALVNLKVLDDNSDVMMITDSGVVIRVHADEISRIGRATKGVRVMRFKDDKAKIVSVALAPYEEDEPEVELDENGNPIVPEEVAAEGENQVAENAVETTEAAVETAEAKNEETAE